MKTTINGQSNAYQLYNPSAWIVKNNRKDESLSNDRGRVKIYPNNTVYLDNEQEFMIELHNPLTMSVLSIIKVQGNLISKNGLVLRPGERVYLDCFIDSKKKFKYNTYQVDNTSESKQAISLNGLIDISFYKEEIVYTQDFPTFDWSYNYGNQFPTLGKTNYRQSFGTGANYGFTNLTTSCNTLKLIGTTNTSSIDTGRIESSEISDTNFTEVNTKFESAKLGGIKYQILPSSTKPFTSDDIKIKNYCNSCGRKLKIEDNFCGSCGNKIK